MHASDTAIDRLRAAAEHVRGAIEATDLTDCGFSLANFPRQCCHHGAKLLAFYLFEQGWDGLRIASGRRGDDATKQHVWLQWGDVILDITADQFGEGLGPVIVTDRSSWHDAWAPRYESIDKERVDVWKTSNLSVHQTYCLILFGSEKRRSRPS